VKYVKNIVNNKNSITDKTIFGRKLRLLAHSGGTNFPENSF
jgi:hypothetical protein